MFDEDDYLAGGDERYSLLYPETGRTVAEDNYIQQQLKEIKRRRIKRSNIICMGKS